MNQKNYTIAMETRSAIYLGKGVFLVDLFLMAAYWFVMDYLRPVVHPDLQIVFSIWNAAVAFLMTRKSRANPQKRILQSLFFALLARRENIYHSRQRKGGEVNYVEERI